MLNRAKGMYDLLPPESEKWRMILQKFRELTHRYGFSEVFTPIVEPAELFSISIGETTDIVEKEMYVFNDRGGRGLALRPEGTASLARAYIENNVAQTDPVARWIYSGPMYRYERPQKGRNRQFYQLGAEVFGVKAPEQDAELIVIGARFLEDIGIKNFRVEISSLGDPSDRNAYRERLVAYLNEHKTRLCPDCLRRLEVNPLRVLDCKVGECALVAADAPIILDHLGEEAGKHFEIVRKTLDRLEVEYLVNPRIVRGLDYYNRTAFEYISENLGAQDAVGGGGRYDGLVRRMGGPDIPAVGFALGIERIAMLIDESGENGLAYDFYFVPLGERSIQKAITLAEKLRREGLRGEVDFSGRRLKHLFARAERLNVRYVLILGDDELKRGAIKLKNMVTKEQKEIELDELGPKALG